MLNRDVDILTPQAEIFAKIQENDRAAAAFILDRAQKAQSASLAGLYAQPENGKGFSVHARNALRGAYNFAVDMFCTEPPVVNIDRLFRMPGDKGMRVMAVSSYVVDAMREHIAAHPAIVEKAGLTRGDIDCLRNRPQKGAALRLSVE